MINVLAYLILQILGFLQKTAITKYNACNR